MWKTLKTNKYLSYLTSFLQKSSTPIEFSSDQIILNSNLNKGLDKTLLMCKSLPSLDITKSFSEDQNDSSVIQSSGKRKRQNSLPKESLKEISDLIEPSSSLNYPSKKKLNLKSRKSINFQDSNNLGILDLNEKEFDDEHNKKDSNYIFNMFSSSIYVNLFDKVKNAFSFSTPRSISRDIKLHGDERLGTEPLAIKENDNLKANILKNRVSVIQYAANNPIEDRYNAIQLKNLNGYCLQVLDGHGGCQVAEFANKRLHVLFDSKILELKENKRLSDHEKIIHSIKYAFKEVVSLHS